MACLITDGNLITCDESFALAGGLDTVWIANSEQITSITDTNADNILDLITMVGTSVFYRFDFHRDGAMFTQTQENVEGGIKLKQTLMLTVPNYDQDKADLLKQLLFAKVVVIAKTRSGRYFILGVGKDSTISFLESEAAEMTSGRANSDLLGTTYTLSGYASSGSPEFNGVIPV